MIKESTILNYLNSTERSFDIKELPVTVPPGHDAWIFKNLNCKDIVAVLEQEVSNSQPVKRVIAQSCENMPLLRGWLKNNGYLIYGEELFKDDDDSFCETTAAVLEGMAEEFEVEEHNKALRVEVFVYGTEELFNELPLLLRANNNIILPELLYSKIAEAETIVIEIDDNEPDESKLSSELYEKRHKALSRIQMLGIMGNSMYPID